MPSVHTAPVIGLPRLDGWSQITTNTQGTLVCAFAISGSNANNLGRDIAEQFLSFEPDSSAQLHQRLLDVLSQVRETSSVLHFAGYLRIDSHVTLITYNGAILLQRNTKVGRVISSHSELKLVEGQQVHGDLVVLTTTQVSPFLQEIQQKLQQQFEVDSIITSILPSLHGQEDSSLSAIAFVTTDPERDEVGAEMTESEPDDQLPEIYQQQPNSGIEILSSNNSISTENSSNSGSHITEVIGPNRQRNKQFGFANNDGIVIRLVRSILLILKRSILFLWRGLRTFVRVLRSMGGARSVYVSSQKQHNFARLVLLAIAIIATIVSLVMWQQKTKREQLSAAASASAPAQVRLEGAKHLAQSNDIVAARKEGQQAVAEFTSLKVAFDKKDYALVYLDEQLELAQKFLTDISAQETVSTLQLFFDLRLTSENFIVSQVSLSKTSALFLDKGKHSVVLLDLAKKSSQTLLIPSSDNLRAIGTDENSLFLLSDGIVRFALADQKSTTLKPAGDSDKGGTILSTFATYLYVLNPEKRNIYRYIIKDDELSEPIGWLTDKTGVNFEQIRSMTIDGDVWLGATDGKIFRFTQGKPTAFEIQGLSQPFSTPVYLYTNEDLETICVLEPDKKRLVLLKKNGELVREITSESLAATNGIIANKELNAAYVVSGSILYQIPL